MTATPKIGFIGAGVMGQPMAGHLLAAGYPVALYNRTRSKAQPLLDQGAEWCEEPAGLAAQSDVLITMVGFPQDVEELYFGDTGLIEQARPGSLLIDMTTSRPDLARSIAESAAARSIAAMDAPVSGGDRGAREAKLSIMAGGSDEAFERALPVLQVMGANIVHQGPAGSGQHTKLCNQIAVAAGMLGACEAIRYAEKSGLDPDTVLRSITSGAAGSWALSNLAPRMLAGDYAPGFYVRHFLKDLKIALDSAAAMQIDLPGLQLAHRLYGELSEMGASDEGTQALIRWYRAPHGKSPRKQ
ncbi:MAG: NAD(P)-dependent oxidoreductase [Opitutales bacterium]